MSEIKDQPMPTSAKGPVIQDLVIADVVERKQVGLERYGQYVHPHNGRDALVDAYQEALDLVMYLRQAIFERDHPQPAPGVINLFHPDGRAKTMDELVVERAQLEEMQRRRG